jgi:hypothetical protein
MILTKFGIYQWILIEVSNTKFHLNLDSGSSTDTCRQAGREKDGRKYGHSDYISSKGALVGFNLTFVNHDTIMKVTNKMQLYRLIYCS